MSAIFSTIGYIIIFSLIGYYNLFVLLLMIIISVIFVSQRNKVVLYCLNNINLLTYRKIIKLLSRLFLVLGSIYILGIVDSYMNDIIFSSVPNILIISLSIGLIYAPFVTVFIDSFSTNGVIKFEFIELDKHFNNFKERQIWMKKILKRMVELLRLGNIDINYDDLVYNLNLKIGESEEMARKHLVVFEQWLYSNLNDECLMNSLHDIISSDNISPLKKRPLNTYFHWLTPEYFKLIITLLAIIYISIAHPELIEMAVSKLLG